DCRKNRRRLAMCRLGAIPPLWKTGPEGSFLLLSTMWMPSWTLRQENDQEQAPPIRTNEASGRLMASPALIERLLDDVSDGHADRTHVLPPSATKPGNRR